MADEATDALIPEAPSTEAAAPTEAPASDPYEKRYADLRSEFDRRNSLLDRARQGDVAAIRELGFDVDEPEDDPTPEYDEDPIDARLSPLQKELEEIKQWKQAQEAERIASGIRSHVDSLAQQAGVELTDTDREYIFRGAVSGDKIGEDTTKAAFEAHIAYRTSLLDAEKANWVQTKKAPRVGTGQAVEKQPDLDNEQERIAWMQAQMMGQ